MARNRSRNIWHVFNRGESSPYWYVWRYDEENPTKRIKRATTKKKADYTREQMTKIVNTVEGLVTEDKGIEYSIDWFEDYVLRKLRLESRSKSTMNEYRYAIKYLRMVYGKDYSILNINRDAIDRLKELMIEKGRKPGTINDYLSVLRAAFERLLIDQKIDRNPFYRFTRMKVDYDTKKHLTYLELQNFLNYVRENSSEEMWRLLRIYSGTGRRRNEILFLESEDVDLDKGIYRPRNLKTGDKKKISRKIPANLIEDFGYFLEKYQGHKYPFQIYHEDVITHHVSKLLTDAGFPTLSLHSLRHTYITILTEMNYSVREAQKIIDHRNYQTTLQYMHDETQESPDIGI